ncbi:MAG: RES family NAD+ phosphorylase [Burkholderiales bacterium]
MAEPLFLKWRAGKQLFRVHDTCYAASQFNDSGKGDARFSPLRSASGKIVPTLYAGQTRSSVLMETVFHDVPTPASDYILDIDDLNGLVMSSIAPRRTLRLLALTSIGLRRLGEAKTRVIETPSSDYPQTRALALAWHDAYRHADGMLWMSRQDDQARALVLFGDRVGEKEFDIFENKIPVDESPRFEELIATAQSIGIRMAYSGKQGMVTMADLMDASP